MCVCPSLQVGCWQTNDKQQTHLVRIFIELRQPLLVCLCMFEQCLLIHAIIMNEKKMMKKGQKNNKKTHVMNSKVGRVRARARHRQTVQNKIQHDSIFHFFSSIFHFSNRNDMIKITYNPFSMTHTHSHTVDDDMV